MKDRAWAHESRFMRKRIGECMRAYFAHILIAFFIMKAALIAFSSLAAILTGALLFPLFIIVIGFNGIFNYGFYAILTRIYRGERVILGHLFSGFKIWFQTASASIIIALSVFGISLILTLPVSLIIIQNPAALSGTGIDEQMRIRLTAMIMAGVALSYLITQLRFGLVYFCLFDKNWGSVSQALQRSSQLLRHKRLRYLCFSIHTGGIWLILALIAGALNIYSILKGDLPSVLTIPVSALASIAGSLALIRMIFGSAAFYDLCKNGSAAKSSGSLQKEPPALPPAEEDH